MNPRVTRRTLIGTGAAAGAAATIPGAAAARTSRPRRADVIVVGAGLSGLQAATDVVAKGKSVIVVEARDRVGGRTLNHHLGGGKVIEVGGQWIGPTQTKLAALAKELGVKTYKTYNTGSYIYYKDGVKTPYEVQPPPIGAIPPDPEGVADAFKAILQLNQMAATIDVEKPWAAASAETWDSQTFQTWMEANAATPNGRFLLELGIEAVFAAQPRDVSLLFVLFYIASATDGKAAPDFQRLINTEGGAQESRFEGGSQLVSIRLAQRLGKRVVLGAPARRIVQRKGGVEVITDKGRFLGKQVVVTGPPSVTAYIDYDPLLPAQRAQLLQRLPQGSVIKCEAIYDKPFWRDKGLAGQITSDAEPVRVTFDNSPPDGSPGVMLGFIEGHLARVWSTKPEKERRAAVLANFATYFGDEALKPTGYVEKDWSKEGWTRGCYGGFTPPGTLLDFGEAIRRPVGRIKWAGAETATLWNGYMDGALRSGSRAADEALGDL